MSCIDNQNGHCKKLSDSEVKQPCIEGPCPQDVTKSEMEEFMKFVSAAIKACPEPGKQTPFTCPICGQTAYAYKANFNGHRAAQCGECKISFRE